MDDSTKVLCDLKIPEVYAAILKKDLKLKAKFSAYKNKVYIGKIESLVGRMTSFADMIQLTHLKLQQVLSRMVPDGVYLDADGIAEIDLGNGNNYNPQDSVYPLTQL